MDSGDTLSATRTALRLVARPVSVPTARAFVDTTLHEWGCARLAGDVSLCIDELATNAVLHSECSYFEVELEKHPGPSVRAAVTDSGSGSADVLARQPELSDACREDLTGEDPSSTGRGMFLVSILATVWGIEEFPVGKRVWAEFHAASVQKSDRPARTEAHITRSPDRAAAMEIFQDWPVVRFRQCPAALLLAHDDNIAEYTRELQLLGDLLDDPAFQRLGDVLSDYVAQHATNWNPARIIAHHAVRTGKERVDIEVLASQNVRASITNLRALVSEAESLSRRGQLMTLPASEPVQRLRDWFEGEFLAQIEDGADPLPYPDWLRGVRRG